MKSNLTPSYDSPAMVSRIATIWFKTPPTIFMDFLALFDDMGDLDEEHAWRAALSDAILRGDGAAVGRILDAYRVRLDLLVSTGTYSPAIQSGLWASMFADLPADQLDTPPAEAGDGDRFHWLQRIVRHLRELHREIDPWLDATEAEAAEALEA